MDRIGKALALLLTATMMISCLTFLTVKLVDAQSTPAPEIKILYPTNGTYFNVSMGVLSFQLKYATNNTLSWLGYSVDGVQNRTAYGEWYNIVQRILDTEGNFNVWVYGVFENDGNHNLTLYANDTAGDWATPQTITYFVNINAGTTFPPTTSAPTSMQPTFPSSTGTATPVPTLKIMTELVPNYPLLMQTALIMVAIIIILVSVLLYRRHRNIINN